MQNQTQIFPVINLNGTSRAALLSGYSNALEALRTAEKALWEIAPHGRDYPGDPASWRLATIQHMARLGSVESAIRQITTIAEITA
jgi:hypothetical protein